MKKSFPKIDNSIKMTLIISGTILILGLIALSIFGRIVPDLGNTVTTEGNSELEVIPDTVSIYLTISELAKESVVVKESADLIYQNLVSEVGKLDIAENDIRTANYNINEDYTWTNGNRKLNGYRVTHALKISFLSEKSELIAEILDAGIMSGATFSYINFELSNELENIYKSQALLLATEDAKGKAEAIAEGLDKKLGRLVSVSTTSFNYQPWKAYENAFGLDVATEEVETRVANIVPTERSVSGRVNVVYKLK